jgi:hypothetical protein
MKMDLDSSTRSTHHCDFLALASASERIRPFLLRLMPLRCMVFTIHRLKKSRININITPAATGAAIDQNQASLWFRLAKSSRFLQNNYVSAISRSNFGNHKRGSHIPKYPTRNERGRKIIVTIVSCLIDSFWYAEMVLKIRSIM